MTLLIIICPRLLGFLAACPFEHTHPRLKSLSGFSIQFNSRSLNLRHIAQQSSQFPIRNHHLIDPSSFMLAARAMHITNSQIIRLAR